MIGFSKSGIGAEDLILKHPDLFTLAAAWDFPADMSSYDEYGRTRTANYGTDANFQANYRLTQAFVDAHKAPFLTNNRIWIGGYNAFPDRHLGLRRPPDVGGDPPHHWPVRADGPPLGRRMGARGVGSPLPGQHPTALTQRWRYRPVVGRLDVGARAIPAGRARRRGQGERGVCRLGTTRLASNVMPRLAQVRDSGVGGPHDPQCGHRVGPSASRR